MYQQIASSIVHANCMKHSEDPNDRSIELPSNDVIDEPFLSEEDLLEDSFENPMSSDSEPESNEVSLLHATKSAPVAEPNSQTASLIENQTVLTPRNLFTHCSLTTAVYNI